MAAEVETSGIIVETSKSSCVISINIDGRTKSFSVSKTIFYVFGVKCEGDLTNLVEEDTEIELSYKLRPGNALTIVAVWLGEKPDLFENANHRVPIYDQKGILNDLIVDANFGQVFVNRGVTFRDGQRENGIVLNEEVMFDALPVEDIHSSGAKYVATCAWIGSTPTLVDRFHLEVDESEDVEFEDDVCGTVVVISNDVVAFVDVEVHCLVKVMLFRSSFSRVCDRIWDSVEVGDVICMRLKYAFVFPGRRHWFAVSAWKASVEVLVDKVCDSGAIGSDDRSDDIEDVKSCLRGGGDHVPKTDILKTNIQKDGVKRTDALNSNRVRRRGLRKNEAETFVTVVNLITSLTSGDCESSTGQAKINKAAAESVEDAAEVSSVDTEEPVNDRSSAKAIDEFGSDQSCAKSVDQFNRDQSPAKATDQIDSGQSFAKATDEFTEDSPVLYKDPPLEGVLSHLDPNGCITFGKMKIFLDSSNFYIGGELCSVDDFARVAKESTVVSFEAVLMSRKEEKNSVCSHEATCAWIEKRPVLAVLMALLPPPNFQLIEEPNRSFYGKVTKICFPSMAFLFLPDDESTVSIHVNAFVTKPHYPTKGICQNLISNFVKLDDWVQFKVTKISTRFVCARDAGPVFSPAVWAKVSPGIAVLHSSSKAETSTSGSKRLSTMVKAPNSSTGSVVCIASPFKPSRFAQDRAYLINCSGIIKVRHDLLLGTEFVTVEHAFGSMKITNKTVYFSNDRILSKHEIAVRNGRKVRFDAQNSMAPNSNAGFVVTRIWEGDARPAPEVVLFLDLTLFEVVSTRCCPAKIIAIPLHDTAIASVKGVPILVPFDALVTLQEVNMACSAIDTFLSVGDIVGLKFEKRMFPGEIKGSYFRAVCCWSLSKGGEKPNLEDEIRITEPRINNWFSLWGKGEFFCKGKMKIIDGKYYVEHYSKSTGKTASYDIFEKGTVCKKGELVDKEKFKASDNDEISFHIGHNYVEKTSKEVPSKMIEPLKLYVACSWTGSDPVVEHFLRDALGVRRGFVHSNRFYDVVVESFPTPMHAICRLGYLSVVVPLPEVWRDGNFCGVEDEFLKKGDRIVVNVLTKEVQSKTVLVSNTRNFKRVKDIEFQDVLKNVSGKIVTSPNPTGLIKAYNCDFEASFELCNVRENTKAQNVDAAWLDSLSKKFTVGKKVYFSALKADTKTAAYRAFEVFAYESVNDCDVKT